MPTTATTVSPKAKLYFILIAGTITLAACASNSTPSTLPEFISENTATISEDAIVTLITADISESTNTPEQVASPTTLPTQTLAATQVPAAQIPDGDFRAWVKVADDFSQPLFVTNAGDSSGRLFVGGQQGRIWVILDSQVLPTAFLDIRARVNSGSNEQGLLGLAFHPQYEENGIFFVNYSATNGDTIISRFLVSADPNLADSTSEEIVLRVSQPYSNHNGGHLEFGPDGYLYIGMGDGGSAGDPQNNGQSLDSLLGAMLRIDIDSAQPYAIPSDNPYANGGGLPEIWASGLRNPWRFSFDALNGDMYIGDVGQNIWEEIDFLAGSSQSGANFGWNYFEGNHAFEGQAPNSIDLIPPVAEYDHGNNRCSITGGVIYRGSQLPELWGVYFYGDFCSGEVFALVRNADSTWQSESVYNLPLLITSFGTDENGEIYLLDRNGGLFSLR
jgi:glucose/arabinose dehydrogenase